MHSSMIVCLACSPPEELVLPRSFPRAPVAFLSAVLSPLAWQFGRPDLFDTYSVGILLMQLCGERICFQCYTVIRC